ncbi:MAG: DUF4169 family protein [Pseudomonadota bacterium]|nr:DUF4169 family protein [Pseudomonadota bacterium]
MSGDVVNLNKARKARDKADAAVKAKANRAKFGQTTAERFKAKLDATKAKRALDGKLRETGDDTSK